MSDNPPGLPPGALPAAPAAPVLVGPPGLDHPSTSIGPVPGPLLSQPVVPGGGLSGVGWAPPSIDTSVPSSSGPVSEASFFDLRANPRFIPSSALLAAQQCGF